jgi:hypothetical protein
MVGAHKVIQIDSLILIENKINNAPDQPDQLPRYFIAAQQTSQLDAILYLSMDGSRAPNESNWRSADPAELRKLIKIIGACTGKEDDLVTGWLNDHALQAADARYRLLAEQYAELLQHSGGLFMPYADMKRFFDFVMEDENLENAKALIEYMRELLTFRSRKVLDAFQAATSAFYSSGLDPVDGFPFFKGLKALPDEEIKLLLIPEADSYRIEFYNQDRNLEPVSRVLRSVSMLQDFTVDSESGRYFRTFSFPAEEKVFYEYVQKLLNRIDSLDTHTI